MITILIELLQKYPTEIDSATSFDGLRSKLSCKVYDPADDANFPSVSGYKAIASRRTVIAQFFFDNVRVEQRRPRPFPMHSQSTPFGVRIAVSIKNFTKLVRFDMLCVRLFGQFILDFL